MMPVILVAGAATLVFLMLAAALSGPSTSKGQRRRMEAVRSRHSTSSETAMQNQLKRIAASRPTGAVDSWAGRLIPRPDVLRARLERTGKGWTLGQYATASAGLALVLTLGLTVKGVPFLIALVAGAVVAVVLPQKVVSVSIRRRVGKFTAKFPDAIELLVRGLRSGLPISETLSVVGSEVPGPVGEEFRGVADRIKIGRSMEAALQDTADRLGTPEFQFFVITLSIQRETGGNLAETLSNLAEVLRKRAAMKLKIRAMSSESKASAYIIGALPFFVFTMIYFVNDKYMAGFFVEPRLMIAGGIGIVWMAIGAFIMAKMVSFEI